MRGGGVSVGRRHAGAEHPRRVGLEGERDRGRPVGGRAGPRGLEEPAVAQVHAVEVADGDRAAAQGAGAARGRGRPSSAAPSRGCRPPPKARGRSAPSVVSTRDPRAPASVTGSPGPANSARVCRHMPQGGVGGTVPLATATASRVRRPARTAASDRGALGADGQPVAGVLHVGPLEDPAAGPDARRRPGSRSRARRRVGGPPARPAPGLGPSRLLQEPFDHGRRLAASMPSSRAWATKASPLPVHPEHLPAGAGLDRRPRGAGSAARAGAPEDDSW